MVTVLWKAVEQRGRWGMGRVRSCTSNRVVSEVERFWVEVLKSGLSSEG